MQELNDSMNNAMDHNTRPPVNLRDVGKKWALHCLETYTEDLLSRGLHISKALAEFANELEGRG